MGRGYRMTGNVLTYPLPTRETGGSAGVGIADLVVATLSGRQRVGLNGSK